MAGINLNFKKILYVLLFYIFNITSIHPDIIYLKTGQVLESSKILDASAQSVTVEYEGEKKTYSMSSEVIRIRYGQDVLEGINILLTDETLLNGFLVEQDVQKVIFRREKHSAKEENILKSDIKQMSNKKILLLYPEIILRGGALQVLNSGGSNLGISSFFMAGYYINPPWFKNIKIGLDIGYGISSNKEIKEQNFTFIPGFFSFQYIFNGAGMEKLTDSITFAERFSYAPHIGIGASFVIFDDGEGEILQSLMPSTLVGFTLYFTVVPRLLFLNLSVDYYGLYEKAGQFHAAMSQLSLQYRY
ncbi:MAG: hypothetical protein OEZ22_12960 [Spirochaetia bacterium]|nr:hypothetical protein [Spirochaetia bacterium]